MLGLLRGEIEKSERGFNTLLFETCRDDARRGVGGVGVGVDVDGEKATVTRIEDLENRLQHVAPADRTAAPAVEPHLGILRISGKHDEGVAFGVQFDGVENGAELGGGDVVLGRAAEHGNREGLLVGIEGAMDLARRGGLDRWEPDDCERLLAGAQAGRVGADADDLGRRAFQGGGCAR